MAEEPSWDDIFRPPGGEPTRPSSPNPPGPVEPVSEQFPQARLSDPYAVAAAEARAAQSAPPATQPMSRREAREAQERAQRGGASGTTARVGTTRRPPRKRRRGWTLALITVFVLLVGTGTTGWFLFEDKIRHVLGWESTDYATSGDGTKVTIVIQSGDIGSDVAKTLQQAGVTKTFDAFYQLLLKKPSVTFEPGSYQLQKQMSAASALAALRDPKNKIVRVAVLKEGVSAQSAFVQLASATGLPVADFQAAAKDYVALGVPAAAPSIEGFLFPATYTFDPGVTAKQALQQLVSTMISHLDKAGVAPADRLKVVTLASIVQRESGPSVADMHKIARVFQNRLDQGMRLQSDATVAYGTGHTDRVTTTSAERADASNKYNTYANNGLPIGPIGLPGDDAIDSALHPTPGPWLFFVAVNLKTGETVFSTTAAEHAAAVKQWQAWCRASAENAVYCK
ncbi:endolytic transglycosylase MltG [Lysinimonas soli]|uniref:Endolytic murein transglycosylase n=1 Tax=Lysinimonas soli TaxID=1074233 RepID=A0ABW0NM97_9MICO